MNALVDEAAKRLVCTLVHGGGTAQQARLDLRQWPKIAPAGKMVTLAASSLDRP